MPVIFPKEEIILDFDGGTQLQIPKISRYVSWFGRIMKVLNKATEFTYFKKGKKKSVFVNTNSLFKRAAKKWVDAGGVKPLKRAWGEPKTISKDDKEIIDGWVNQAKKETSKTHKKKLSQKSLTAIITNWQFDLGTMPLEELFPGGNPAWSVPLDGMMFGKQ